MMKIEYIIERYFKNTKLVFFIFFVSIYFPVLMGPYSFVEPHEADHVIPIYEYFLKIHPGGEFAHKVGAGRDIGAFGAGLEIFSIYKFMRSILPVSAALAIEKIIVFIVSFGGVYLVSRRFINAGNLPSIFSAFLFVCWVTIGPFESIFRFGYFLLPLAVYCCSIPWDNKNAIWLLIATVILSAVGNPVHSLIGIVLASFFGPLMLGQFSIRRSCIFSSFCIIVTVINWHEHLIAWYILLPFSSTGIATEYIVYKFDTLVTMIVSQYTALGLKSLGLFSLVGLVLLKYRGVIKFILVYTAFILVALTALSIPWQDLGMGFIHKPLGAVWAPLNILSILIICTFLFQFGFYLEDRLNTLYICIKYLYSRKHIITMLAILLVLVDIHFYNYRVLMHQGNQGYFSGIANLRDRSWQTRESFRALTTGSRFPLSLLVTSFYGLDTIGGRINIRSQEQSAFWSQLEYWFRENPNAPYHSTMVHMKFDHYSWEKFRFNVDAQLSTDILRLANVKYIISELRLHGENLKQISGLPEPSPAFHYLVKNWQEKFLHYKWRISKFFNYGEIFVYELSDALPRYYSPKKLIVVPDTTSAQELVRLAGEKASALQSVVKSSDFRRLIHHDGHVDVSGYREIKNGIDLSIAAPEGGLLTVNYFWSPFWKASGDGLPLEIVRTNGMHMSISVPPETQNVKFSYHRPSGFSEVIEYLKNRRGRNQ